MPHKLLTCRLAQAIAETLSSGPGQQMHVTVREQYSNILKERPLQLDRSSKNKNNFAGKGVTQRQSLSGNSLLIASGTIIVDCNENPQELLMHRFKLEKIETAANQNIQQTDLGTSTVSNPSTSLTNGDPSHVLVS